MVSTVQPGRIYDSIFEGRCASQSKIWTDNVMHVRLSLSKRDTRRGEEDQFYESKGWLGKLPPAPYANANP